MIVAVPVLPVAGFWQAFCIAVNNIAIPAGGLPITAAHAQATFVFQAGMSQACCDSYCQCLLDLARLPSEKFVLWETVTQCRANSAAANGSPTSVTFVCLPGTATKILFPGPGGVFMINLEWDNLLARHVSSDEVVLASGFCDPICFAGLGKSAFLCLGHEIGHFLRAAVLTPPYAPFPALPAVPGGFAFPPPAAGDAYSACLIAAYRQAQNFISPAFFNLAPGAVNAPEMRFFMRIWSNAANDFFVAFTEFVNILPSAGMLPPLAVGAVPVGPAPTAVYGDGLAAGEAWHLANAPTTTPGVALRIRPRFFSLNCFHADLDVHGAPPAIAFVRFSHFSAELFDASFRNLPRDVRSRFLTLVAMLVTAIPNAAVPFNAAAPNPTLAVANLPRLGVCSRGCCCCSVC
jgi:hypothetical protein